MTNNANIHSITTILLAFGASNVTQPATINSVILSFNMSADNILRLMTAAIRDDLGFALIMDSADSEANLYSIDITNVI